MARLTLEELDRRAEEKRLAFIAKQEAASKAKAAREAGRAGRLKFEALQRYLERNELALHVAPASWEGEVQSVDLFWRDEHVGELLPGGGAIAPGSL